MTGDRYVATLRRLETLFEAAYPINQNRPSGRVSSHWAAMLATAILFWRAPAARHLGQRSSRYRSGDVTRGDAYLETVRALTSRSSGICLEQFDQVTGAQTSAKHLTWSYAAFLTAVAARRSL